MKKNSKSILSMFKNIIPIKYFASEWSFSQFRVPELKSICSFGITKNTILSINYINKAAISNGVLYEGLIDTKNGGICLKTNEFKLSLIGNKNV